MLVSRICWFGDWPRGPRRRLKVIGKGWGWCDGLRFAAEDAGGRAKVDKVDGGSVAVRLCDVRFVRRQEM